MKTYLLDIIPKIQRFSQKLDDLTVLLNKHWVILDEESMNKIVFIFREKNNQLLISNNGKIEKGTWDYLGSNSLLIDRESGSYLFKHGFVDECVLALKVDGKEEYALLVNEQWHEKQIKSLETLLSFLNEKYLVQTLKNTISIPKTTTNENTNTISSINNFIISWNDITVPDKIKKEMLMEVNFMTYSLKEIDYYIKFFNSTLYPFYAAVALDSKNIKLSNQLNHNLLSIANREFGMKTINEVLKTIAINEYK